MRTPASFYALAGLFALCVPLLGIYPVFMMKLLCFAMFACAYNLLLGFGRMLSFGHAAFFGSAAYATAWLVDRARLGAGGGDPRRCRGRRAARPGRSARSRSAARASISR